VLVVPLTAIAGCRASDQNWAFDHVHAQLHELALISSALFQKGYDLGTIQSVADLLKTAIDTKVAETHSDEELEKDYWGNPYHWNVIAVEDGVTIFISSTGRPAADSQHTHKEPFVRVQLYRNREPTIQFYDIEEN
jgi:hypothetical protein